jgi:hypothetical protein
VLAFLEALGGLLLAGAIDGLLFEMKVLSNFPRVFAPMVLILGPPPVLVTGMS